MGALGARGGGAAVAAAGGTGRVYYYRAIGRLATSRITLVWVALSHASGNTS